jgi:hypothetical protein
MANVHKSFILLIVLLFSVTIASPIAAAQTQQREPSNPLHNLWRRGVASTSLHVSFLSYKPSLEQFTTLLTAFGSPGLDAAIMPSAAVTFTHSPQFSSRLEIGYWKNETEIPPPNASNLSATLIPVSVHLLYRPALLQDFLPLYLGGGVGFSHLSVGGSALDLLEQQGVTVDEDNSGLTGYILVGLAYPLMNGRLAFNLEAKRLLKTFTTSGTPPLELDFDGTAIGVGLGLRL